MNVELVVDKIKEIQFSEGLQTVYIQYWNISFTPVALKLWTLPISHLTWSAMIVIVADPLNTESC